MSIDKLVKTYDNSQEVRDRRSVDVNYHTQICKDLFDIVKKIHALDSLGQWYCRKKYDKLIENEIVTPEVQLECAVESYRVVEQLQNQPYNVWVQSYLLDFK